MQMTENRLQLEGRTIKQVFEQVNDLLRERVPRFAEDGHGFGPAWSNLAGYGAHDPWPVSYRWISCYAIHGGSEGFYIHVDAVLPPPLKGTDPEMHRSVFLSFEKVWSKALAIEVAGALADLFIEAI